MSEIKTDSKPIANSKYSDSNRITNTKYSDSNRKMIIISIYNMLYTDFYLLSGFIRFLLISYIIKKKRLLYFIIITSYIFYFYITILLFFVFFVIARIERFVNVCIHFEIQNIICRRVAFKHS